MDWQTGQSRCYVITRAAALRMLAFTATFSNAVDNAIDRHWEHKLRLFLISPEFVQIADVESNIGNRFESDTIIGKIRAKLYRRVDKIVMTIYHWRKRPTSPKSIVPGA
jgi:glycosyl transferase, family 25